MTLRDLLLLKIILCPGRLVRAASKTIMYKGTAIETFEHLKVYVVRRQEEAEWQACGSEGA